MYRTAMLVIGGGLLLAGCRDSAMEPAGMQPLVVSVSPGDGVVGVSRGTPVVISFGHTMMSGMERFIGIHEAGQAQAVAGEWSWADDFRTLTFRPAAMLNEGMHTVRVGRDPATGANMCDAHAQHHAAGTGQHMHGAGHMSMMGMGSHRMSGLTLNGMAHRGCEGATTFRTG
jgi:hypothetical protein